MSERPNSPQSSFRHSRLSAAQLREVRKELLVARAAVERMTVLEARQDLAGQLTPFGWLGLLVPGFRRRAEAGNVEGLLSTLPAFLQPVAQILLPLLRRHPLSSALLSLLLGLPSSTRLRKAGGSAKWAGAAVLGFKAWGLWRRFSTYRTTRRQRQH